MKALPKQIAPSIKLRNFPPMAPLFPEQRLHIQPKHVFRAICKAHDACRHANHRFINSLKSRDAPLACSCVHATQFGGRPVAAVQWPHHPLDVRRVLLRAVGKGHGCRRRGIVAGRGKPSGGVGAGREGWGRGRLRPGGRGADGREVGRLPGMDGKGREVGGRGYSTSNRTR